MAPQRTGWELSYPQVPGQDASRPLVLERVCLSAAGIKCPGGQGHRSQTPAQASPLWMGLLSHKDVEAQCWTGPLSPKRGLSLKCRGLCARIAGHLRPTRGPVVTHKTPREWLGGCAGDTGSRPGGRSPHHPCVPPELRPQGRLGDHHAGPRHPAESHMGTGTPPFPPQAGCPVAYPVPSRVPGRALSCVFPWEDGVIQRPQGLRR